MDGLTQFCSCRPFFFPKLRDVEQMLQYPLKSAGAVLGAGGKYHMCTKQLTSSENLLQVTGRLAEPLSDSTGPILNVEDFKNDLMLLHRVCNPPP